MYKFGIAAVGLSLLLTSTAVVDGAEKAELVGTIRGHKGAVKSLQFSQAGNSLLSGSVDGTAKTWNLANGEMIESMSKRRMGIDRAVYSPDSRYVLTTSREAKVGVWDASTGKLYHTLEGVSGRQLALSMSPDGAYVAVGYENSSIVIWRISDRQPLHVIKGHEGPVTNVEFSPDSQYLATVGKDGAIRVWEVITGYLAFSMRSDSSLNVLRFDPKGQNIAVAGDNVTLFNMRSGAISKTFRGHDGAIRDMAFSPNGKFLLTGSDDQTAKLWSITSGRLLDTLENQEGSIISVAFSSDGLYAATGSGESPQPQARGSGQNAIAVWDISEIYSDTRISLHVERELYHWVRKGEFEKQASHDARMNTVHIQAGKLFTDAYRKFDNDVREGASLSKYDVESEEFIITLPALGEFRVHVPLKVAREFKENFSEMVYRNFIVEPELRVPGGSSWDLKRVEIFSPGMKQSFFYGESSEDSVTR